MKYLLHTLTEGGFPCRLATSGGIIVNNITWVTEETSMNNIAYNDMTPK